ncbi:small terminase subunit [Desulfovibrio sp. X2]|uniref:phage terminase small subunit n=1 Tax=Desulfovibrio sp. X2 TaxID=941449 RepID=UPI000358E048|nr:phage terminase small subunit [Desulfovibrio sp. X2]EPR43130.1 small terminase subunit [Desulfovibrio sp. X2]
MSLMRKHQQKVAAAAAAPAGQAIAPGARVLGTMPQGLMGGSKLAAMVTASLREDLDQLHGLASVERKADLKRDVLLPKYRDYVARLMADGKPHELLGWYLVWCFDAGRIEEALQVASWCMAHGQGLPEKFKSSLPLFVASQTLAWAEGEYNAARTFSPYLGQILADMEGDDASAWDVPDQVKAGFYRLIGLQAEKDGDLQAASGALERAMDLGAKVKTALEGVRKRLSRTDTTTPAPAASAPEDSGADKADEANG